MNFFNQKQKKGGFCFWILKISFGIYCASVNLKLTPIFVFDVGNESDVKGVFMILSKKIRIWKRSLNM
jgi:hypothetical protein